MAFRKGLSAEILAKKLKGIESIYAVITAPGARKKLSSASLLLKRVLLVKELEDITGESFKGTQDFKQRVPIAIEELRAKVRQAKEKENSGSEKRD